MTKPPFEVLMKGPEAYAAWLASNRDIFGMSRDVVEKMVTVGNAIGIKEMKSEDDFIATLVAVAQLAAVLAWAAKKGMRGPARDALSEIIDGAFDVIDDTEDPKLRALFEDFKNAAGRRG
jgi:hypothetical protein